MSNCWWRITPRTKPMRLCRAAAILVYLCSVSASNAQEAFATIGAIRDGLSEALVGVQEATVTAGSEGQALGNSLQANIQNVIADIDSRFSKHRDYTLDRLDGAEKQFMSDARDLIFKTQAAAKALSKTVGD